MTHRRNLFLDEDTTDLQNSQHLPAKPNLPDNFIRDRLRNQPQANGSPLTNRSEKSHTKFKLFNNSRQRSMESIDLRYSNNGQENSNVLFPLNLLIKQSNILTPELLSSTRKKIQSSKGEKNVVGHVQNKCNGNDNEEIHTYNGIFEKHEKIKIKRCDSLTRRKSSMSSLKFAKKKESKKGLGIYLREYKSQSVSFQSYQLAHDISTHHDDFKTKQYAINMNDKKEKKSFTPRQKPQIKQLGIQDNPLTSLLANFIDKNGSEKETKEQNKNQYKILEMTKVIHQINNEVCQHCKHCQYNNNKGKYKQKQINHLKSIKQLYKKNCKKISQMFKSISQIYQKISQQLKQYKIFISISLKQCQQCLNKIISNTHPQTNISNGDQKKNHHKFQNPLTKQQKQISKNKLTSMDVFRNEQFKKIHRNTNDVQKKLKQFQNTQVTEHKIFNMDYIKSFHNSDNPRSPPTKQNPHQKQPRKKAASTRKQPYQPTFSHQKPPPDSTTDKQQQKNQRKYHRSLDSFKSSYKNIQTALKNLKNFIQ